MAAPFETEHLALGYAAARPPVHRLIIEECIRRSGRRALFRRALDVGCGAGLSTKALAELARQSFGIEPVSSMLQRASTVAPSAYFVNGLAECLPFVSEVFDLITAAGSLNYVALDRFFPEAARVLSDGGLLAVYDFAPGVTLREHPGELESWFRAFEAKFPYNPRDAAALSPEILSRVSTCFVLQDSQQMEVGIVLTPDFYVEYMMTETNVANAVRSGTPYEEVRSWCTNTLACFWRTDPKKVLFSGYYAAFAKVDPRDATA